MRLREPEDGAAEGAEEGPSSLSGTLLVAHPTLRDPNFCRTVVLLSAHSAEDGALGVVLNRPLGKTLGQQAESFRHSPLADVPVHYGGPVEDERIILAGWQWEVETRVFRLFFGLPPAKAERLRAEHPRLTLRAFLGYSGWSGGQLEGELKQDAWVVAPIDGERIHRLGGTALWRATLGALSPELRFFADAPDDPAVN